MNQRLFLTKMPNPIDSIIKEFEEKFHNGEDRIGDRKDNYSTLGIYEKIEQFLRQSFPKYCEQMLDEDHEKMNTKLHELFDKFSEDPEFSEAVDKLANPILFVLGHEKVSTPPSLKQSKT